MRFWVHSVQHFKRVVQLDWNVCRQAIRMMQCKMSVERQCKHMYTHSVHAERIIVRNALCRIHGHMSGTTPVPGYECRMPCLRPMQHAAIDANSIIETPV